MKSEVDVSVEHSRRQIYISALLEGVSSLSDVLSLLLKELEKNELWYSDFDLADRDDLERVSSEQLMIETFVPDAIANGFRIDFCHQKVGSVVLCCSEIDVGIQKAVAYVHIDNSEEDLDSFLRCFLVSGCRQIYASYDLDVWQQNCDDPDLFQAVNVDIPSTAVICEEHFGNRIIRRLAVDSNPGIERYNSTDQVFETAGWKNILRIDVLEKLTGTSKNDLKDNLQKRFLEEDLEVGLYFEGKFMRIDAPTRVDEISTEFGRKFQMQFVEFLKSNDK